MKVKQALLIFGILLTTVWQTWAISPCTSLSPELSMVQTGTGSYNFQISYTPLSGYVLDHIDWDFDDGTTVTNTSTLMPHQFYYSNSTTFNVTATCYFVEGGQEYGCGTSIEVTVPDEQPEIGCPVAIFHDPSGCPSGEYLFYWNFANLDYDGSGSPDNYWTADYVEWNFGDGQTAVSQGTSSITHFYSNSEPFIVTATAYFTGANNETCSIQLVYLGIGYTAEDLVDDPSLFYTGYLELEPQVANPGLYVQSSTDELCNSNIISVYNFGEIIPTPPSYTNWSYELFIDGQSITSGSGIPDNTNPIYQSTFSAGDYSLEIVYTYQEVEQNPCSTSEAIQITVEDCPDPCTDCNSFKPIPEERYWVSAWVKVDVLEQVLTYHNAYLSIEFVGPGTSVSFYPSGDIVEGWQRIVGSFTIPANTTDLKIHMNNDNESLDAYFDDIRIHPFNASMKSYVYDPETYWLTAELDDNNYATFYEYDKEGQLIRIKKETARGIMTIQESRSSNPKKD